MSAAARVVSLSSRCANTLGRACEAGVRNTSVRPAASSGSLVSGMRATVALGRDARVEA